AKRRLAADPAALARYPDDVPRPRTNERLRHARCIVHRKFRRHGGPCSLLTADSARVFDALNYLHDIEIDILFPPNSESCLLHVTDGVSVEVRTDAIGQWGHQVKQYAERADPAAHVFKHQDLSARFEHAV